jgi:uncharacterized membrane protein YdjX (TVP38/TMEM64 family)
MSRRQLNPLKLLFGSLWLGLFLLALTLWWQSQLPLSDIPALLEHWLSDFGLLKAAAVYVVLYTVRPLILFPATVLTVASGLIFGPWLGTLFTILGENASANLAFTLARWFGRKAVANHRTARLTRWDDALQRNGVTAVMTMRLTMLPFDAVNFGCGVTAIRQRDYALGTFVGILPSLIGFVLLGGMAASGVHHHVLILVLSLGFLALSFGIARHLKHRDEILPVAKTNERLP